MTEKVTANTPRLSFRGTPFCTECRPFWAQVPLDEPRGTYRTSWKCLECQQVMPVVLENPEYNWYAIDWVHAETCDALHDPCRCKVRNKRPTVRFCRPCLSEAGKYLRKEGEKIDAQMPKQHKRRGRDAKQSPRGGDPSPWRENAVRAMEDQ